ncbi:MAG: hypothetical protein WCV90_07100 [Candidatus Woesearchaeota archaeon]|jgi:hypothetical protein
MITTELICSRTYSQTLNTQLNDSDWGRIVDAGKRLDAPYQQNMPYFLERIPIYTGFNWDNGLSIPIYLADFDGPSRTNPVTIKIGAVEDMLVKIIHELIHLNFPNSIFNLNDNVYEDVVNQVTLRIAEDQDIKGVISLEQMLSYRTSLLGKEIELPVIDLDKVNVRDYFLKRVL